uniref:ATP synthase subunit a n=1 Tax=Xenos yangi TaxID=2980483 RepID=A0A977LJR4_9NEOP|nr:ATP synthase F0 subunit 6 [Xenos yangi]
MMMNLFNVFDPATNNILPNWIIIFFIIFMWPNYWMNNTPFTKLMKYINHSLLNEMNLIDKKMSLLIISLFSYIYMINLYGQIPHIFPFSSHLSFTLSLSLPFWISSMIKSLYYSMNLFFFNLIPSGTPLMMMPFMVLIEMTSILIRPITLSIRLMANMTSGHLMMSFISSLNLNILCITMMTMTQMIYLILEIFISIIQAYIFMLLISLYNN